VLEPHCYTTSICTNKFNNIPQPKSLKHEPILNLLDLLQINSTTSPFSSCSVLLLRFCCHDSAAVNLLPRFFFRTFPAALFLIHFSRHTFSATLFLPHFSCHTFSVALFLLQFSYCDFFCRTFSTIVFCHNFSATLFLPHFFCHTFLYQ
jgi:hypothetical protein